MSKLDHLPRFHPQSSRPHEKAEFTVAEPKQAAQALARDFMRENVPILTEKATVREAMHLFAKEGITDSPVVDERGHVTAFLSSSDIMAQLVERKMITPDLAGWSTISDNETLSMRLDELIDRSVMSIATKNVVTVGVDDSFEHVCAVLSQRRFKKVPVVDDGRLLGAINRDDVVGHILDILAKP